jgi:hypothetical protein
MTDATPACLIDTFADPTAAEPMDILADRTRFRSPFADYTGRADISHLIGLINEVLSDVRPARRLSAGPTTMTRFDARVADEEVQGVLCEERDDHDRVMDAMLTIRPYARLRAAMRAMGELMDASPLPSTRGDG